MPTPERATPQATRSGRARWTRYLKEPNMSSARSALIALMVATLGIWGCARGPNGAADADHVRALEARTVKLEDDFRAAATTRDQLRKKLAAAEELQRKTRDELEQQVQALTRERDELNTQLAQRTGERDALAGQYEQFRKNIRDVLGQAEASLKQAPTEQPVTSADARLKEEL
jgi:septal ring factor EnvC (AmiA/AmiB activator)